MGNCAPTPPLLRELNGVAEAVYNSPRLTNMPQQEASTDLISTASWPTNRPCRCSTIRARVRASLDRGM
jgi:hypothetical protein